MSGDLESVAAATAAVLVAGSRAGSAVLVDGRHLLTAAHVLRGAGGEVELVFPGALPGSDRSEARLAARPSTPVAAAGMVDAAVLDLGPDPPAWLPRPVSLWAAGRLPARVTVLGYPLAERALRGVWRDFDVSGPAADGSVQLNWAGERGTLPGHSGGPVVEPATAALVGVLVEGSERGLFDRFVPLGAIRRVWPQVPRPWLMAGSAARDHFSRRAYGQRSTGRGGDLFRGREAALMAVQTWLRSEVPPGRVLVVTGQPGAGKSAVVARAVLRLEADGVGPGLAFHARGATLTDVLAAVADLVGVSAAASPDALIETIEARGADRWAVVVDALDEAAGAAERRRIAETLEGLAALPGLRVAAATRAVAAGDRYVPSGLLRALGASGVSSTNLVDLDTDRYFDPVGLRQFAAALLVQDGALHPGPPGAAWTGYRSRVRVCDRLARVIGARAGRNHLVVALAAVQLSKADEVIDPGSPDFDPRRVPSGVGEALGKYLEALPDWERVRARALLTALAYARGDGIDDRTWLGFAAALGYALDATDLDRLRDSTAADYLLQSVTPDAGQVTRLFHQALVDELLAGRYRPGDERALLQTLLPGPGTRGWAGASRYARVHAAEHADVSGDLPRLVEDAHYLAVADLTRLLPLLSPPERFGGIAAVLRRAGLRAAGLPPARRARLLALTAAHLGLGELRDRLSGACDEGITPRWAHSLGAPHQKLTGHTGEVRALAMGWIGQRQVIVSGGDDGTVRVWDAGSGVPMGAPLAGHAGPVSAVAVGTVDEREVIVSGSDDGTVRVWDAASGQPWAAPLAGHTGWVRAVAVGRVGERDVIVSGGDRTVRIWDAGAEERLGVPLGGHTDPVRAMATGRAGGREVVVSCGDDSTVRVWDAATGEPLDRPLSGHTGRVCSVAVGQVDERDVIVSGGGDSTVRIWDAADGVPLGAPLAGHATWVSAVALARIDERSVVVSGSEDGTLRVWDASSGEPLGTPLVAHTGWVCAVGAGRIGDRAVFVSGGDDSTVRIWDAVSGAPVGVPLAGHTGRVDALAVGRIGQRAVIVSGGDDGTVRIWDAISGVPMGAPLAGHAGAVTGVAIGGIGGREVVVSGGVDSTVRVWDAERQSATVLDFLEPVGAVALSVEGTLWAATGAAVCLLRSEGGTGWPPSS